MFDVTRGQIYYAELNSTEKNIQNGLRPVLVIQNDIGNTYAPTVIVVPITKVNKKTYIPTHVCLPAVSSGLREDSMCLCEQITTISKTQLKAYITSIKNKNTILAINRAIVCSLGLTKPMTSRSI